MKGTSVWILINKNHRHFSHKPGVITMFKCQYKAAMIAHYELDPEEEWQFHLSETIDLTKEPTKILIVSSEEDVHDFRTQRDALFVFCE